MAEGRGSTLDSSCCCQSHWTDGRKLEETLTANYHWTIQLAYWEKIKLKSTLYFTFKFNLRSPASPLCQSWSADGTTSSAEYVRPSLSLVRRSGTRCQSTFETRRSVLITLQSHWRRGSLEYTSVLSGGRVIRCRTCDREVAGSNPARGCCVPTPTQRAIPKRSTNEYQWKLGSKRAYHAMHWPRIRGLAASADVRLRAKWNGDPRRPIMGLKARERTSLT